MESVVRAAAVYFFVWLTLRLAGKRTFSEMTTFDFVLLLIIGDSTQQALLGSDFSFTNAAVVVMTLVSIDIGLSLWKQRSKRVEKVLDSLPLVILENGIPFKERMEKERVDEQDILAAARRWRGLRRLEQIKYAVLERDGSISILPHDARRSRPRRRKTQ